MKRDRSLARQIAEIATAMGLHVGEGLFTLHRTHAGRVQRSAGAWSWWLANGEGLEITGSCWPAKEVVRAHREGRLVRNYGTCELIVEHKEAGK